MSAKPRLAKDVARQQGPGRFWIDHAVIVDDDLEWLASAERLTLWNVKLPVGFLACLPALWWLDIRGGSAESIDHVADAAGLEYLNVNQVRGVSDLSAIASLPKLRLLCLYGLARVTTAPSLATLSALRRIEVGQMKSLSSLGALLDAPGLDELLLVRRVSITQADLGRIAAHPTLREFDWFAEDVPVKVWKPVLEMVKLPRARPMHADEWFDLHGRGGIAGVGVSDA